MFKAPLLILLGVVLLSINSHANAELSDEAVEGKTFYPACNVCHNPVMDPPLGPPMWGVKRRYIRNALDKEDFVINMVDFVKAPTRESAIHDEAIEQLGLMPPMPLPDDMLKKIATYVFEKQFPPPCEHWRIALARAEKKGDLAHATKDQNQLKRFCN